MADQHYGPYGNIRRAPNRCNQIDTHELLKKEIYRQGIDDAAYKFGLHVPPGAGATSSSLASPSTFGVEDTYLYFDSLAKDSTSDLPNGEVTWSIVNLNNSRPLENIVEMKINDFWFPLIKNASTAPDYYFYRRVYMQVTTAPSQQAVQMQNYGAYHFEFDVDVINSVAVHLRPVQDTYYFQRPISSLSVFTARFYVPHDPSANFRKIPIPADKAVATLVTQANPSRWHFTAEPTSIMGDIGVPTAPGVAVYGGGVSSSVTAFNSAANSSQGLFVNNILDATDFTIANLDSTLVPLAPTVSANFTIPKNRIAIQMRFTSVREQHTNYLTGSHI